MILLIVCLVLCISVIECAPNMGYFEDNDVPCTCVPPELCADEEASQTDQSFFDIRMDGSDCPNYFDVCCENVLNKSQLETRVFKKCGTHNPFHMNARITSNSENAVFGELPWSIIILQRNMYKCGGSLIHPQVVVTAAHCVQETTSDKLTVRAGEWNIKSRDEPIPHQDGAVDEILIHHHYHPGTLRNDIALLFLEEPFEMADNVGVICMPSKEVEIDEDNCIGSGWGKEVLKKGTHSSIIKKVVLPLVPRKKCISALRSTRLGTQYNLHRSFLCAGGEKDKDTCRGDGGSPLICPILNDDNEKRFLQVGIVSWGIGCGETETPGVYVNLAIYIGWIDKQLTARNFDTSVYKV